MKFLPNGFATVIGSAAALALSMGFAPAHAQEAPTQQPATPTQPPAAEPTQPPAAAEVDDATLQAFAQASLDVEEVISTWSPRIQSAENEQQAEEMRTSANQEIREALQSNGLEVETYNQVYQLAQANPEVANTIQRYRQELQ
ncbi:DUF4168 domain-containing protein [Nitratireductor sp. GCM10026969]|uniref:DUF4168 domain-containing protein n=1 Tax=Nitratireductor sp. GCM10026969 TaxID=3252645 RepID=UPI0036094CCE